MNIRERLGKELLFLDGGMGPLLQAEGLAPGELPETWNIEPAWGAWPPSVGVKKPFGSPAPCLR